HGVDFRFNIRHRIGVIFLDGKFQQLAGIANTAIQIVNGFYHRLQQGALAAQFLGFFRLVPDVWLCQQQLYLGEAFFLVIVVKDTP
ncbi:MAG: hypothetical protein OIF34_08135, partial [Porticoccaceae bacterium]|nr:hypothetical protein [Porticoccaceae bacterium]